MQTESHSKEKHRSEILIRQAARFPMEVGNWEREVGMDMDVAIRLCCVNGEVWEMLW